MHFLVIAQDNKICTVHVIKYPIVFISQYNFVHTNYVYITAMSRFFESCVWKNGQSVTL